MACAIMLGMTKEEALAHYGGNQSELARALGIDQSTVNKWKRVPVTRQLQLEALTSGRLRADEEADKFRVPMRRKVAA